MSERSDEVTAGVWKYIEFLTGAEVQSRVGGAHRVRARA